MAPSLPRAGDGSTSLWHTQGSPSLVLRQLSKGKLPEETPALNGKWVRGCSNLFLENSQKERQHSLN